MFASITTMLCPLPQLDGSPMHVDKVGAYMARISPAITWLFDRKRLRQDQSTVPPSALGGM
jgi:hypothetical protein